MKFLFGWKGLTIAIIILLALIVILVVEVRNNRQAYDSDIDFEFSLNFGTYGKNNINTYEDTITKDLVSAGRRTVEYVLPEEIKKKIFSMMKMKDFMSFPENLNIQIYDGYTKHLSLKVTIGGKEHTVRWNVPWDLEKVAKARMTAYHLGFLDIVEYISNYVHESPEWKALPKSEGSYL